MPKLKPTEQEEVNRIIRSCITGNMSRQGMDNAEFARRLGVSVSTIQNKMNRPETFTAKELYRASKILKFSPFQAASIVLGRELTVKEVFDGTLKF